MKIKKKVEEVKEPIIEEAVVEEPKKEEKNTEPVFYVFKPTDTLESVAKKFNTTADKLRELNGNVSISASNQMRVK